MPLYFHKKTDEGIVEIEITDDGAMVIPDYDIDEDIIAAELGAHLTHGYNRYN